MWTGTGCDSSAAFKALVSPPPVLSAEARSFENLVSGAGKLQLRCNGCGHTRPAKALSPEQVRATGGDFGSQRSMSIALTAEDLIKSIPTT